MGEEQFSKECYNYWIKRD